MRYIVKQVEEGYEFTHIEEKENLQGEMIEVVKGRNTFKKEDVEKNIDGLQEEIKKFENMITDEEIQKKVDDLKEDIQGNIDIMKDQLTTLNKFIEEINKLG